MLQITVGIVENPYCIFQSISTKPYTRFFADLPKYLLFIVGLNRLVVGPKRGDLCFVEILYQIQAHAGAFHPPEFNGLKQFHVVIRKTIHPFIISDCDV